MPDEQTYPYLARYAKGATLAARIQKAKRPLQWLRWAMFIPGMYLIGERQELVAGFFVLVGGSFFFEYLDDALRLKTFKVRELYRKAVGNQLPRIVKQLMEKGKFSISGEAGASLERCAQFTIEIQANYVDAYMLGGTGLPQLKKTFQDLINGSDALMRAALNSLYRPIMTRVDPSSDELAEVEKIESDLRILHDEADQIRQLGKKPALDQASQDTIDRIKATIELRQDH